MTRPDWIPAAFLLPPFLLRAAVAVIEAACDLWEEACPCGDEEPCGQGCGEVAG